MSPHMAHKRFLPPPLFPLAFLVSPRSPKVAFNSLVKPDHHWHLSGSPYTHMNIHHICTHKKRRKTTSREDSSFPIILAHSIAVTKTLAVTENSDDFGLWFWKLENPRTGCWQVARALDCISDKVENTTWSDIECQLRIRFTLLWTQGCLHRVPP